MSEPYKSTWAEPLPADEIARQQAVKGIISNIVHNLQCVFVDGLSMLFNYEQI